MAKLLVLANDESTIYNFRREVLRAFHKSGHEIVLCLPAGEHTEELEACGCRVVDVAVDRHGTDPLQDIRYYLTCRKLIRKHKPDLVLTYTVKPNIYGSLACQAEKIPYFNNVTGLGAVLQHSSPLASLVLFLQKLAYRKSSCVFFQNESNYHALLEKNVVFANTPVEILPGSGVNLDLHAYVPMREEDGAFRFIMVARLRDDKGYREFFAAAEQVRSNHPNTEFHVVGWCEEDVYRQRVKELSRKGVIIYHGKQVQEEVHRLIAMCDCAVLPSYHEGMANVLLEAAAAGRPVIASDIPGCRETFDEGVTGFGCEVKNAASLEQAMERMIALPYAARVEMGKRGREKMERNFDRHFVANRYIKKIVSVISK